MFKYSKFREIFAGKKRKQSILSISFRDVHPRSRLRSIQTSARTSSSSQIAWGSTENYGPLATNLEILTGSPLTIDFLWRLLGQPGTNYFFFEYCIQKEINEERRRSVESTKWLS